MTASATPLQQPHCQSKTACWVGQGASANAHRAAGNTLHTTTASTCRVELSHCATHGFAGAGGQPFSPDGFASWSSLAHLSNRSRRSLTSAHWQAAWCYLVLQAIPLAGKMSAPWAPWEIFPALGPARHSTPNLESGTILATSDRFWTVAIRRKL